jgi:crotonobetainyl-CoA:carnitine CoA-transferase CaiB-like acyl-CoA transferase
VLVEQFRPGVMERLGLGFEALHAINPRLVYCSITGYGQSGPRAEEAGHDLNYIGNTGLLALNPGPPDRPVVPPALIADIGGGTLPAVINILLGLRQLTRLGRQPCRAGRRHVHVRGALASVRPPGRFGMGGAGSRAARRAISYPTRDGGSVCCAALEQVLACIYASDRACPGSSTTAAIRRQARLRSRHHRRQDRRPMAAGARRRHCCVTIWRAWRRRLAIHVSSREDCSPTVAGIDYAALPCRSINVSRQAGTVRAVRSWR